AEARSRECNYRPSHPSAPPPIARPSPPADGQASGPERARVGAALVLESKIAEILIFADEDTPFRACQGDHLVVGGARTQVGGGYHVVPCCPQRLSYDRRHVLVDQKPHRATRPLQP